VVHRAWSRRASFAWWPNVAHLYRFCARIHSNFASGV
jgi:hypothetical protein